MPACPSCGRPVAMARPRCLYCDASLSAGLAEAGHEAPSPSATAESAPDATRSSTRRLVVLETDKADAEALARVSGLSRYEAGLLVQRRHPYLHRILDLADADRELARLRDAGLVGFAIPETEARLPVLCAIGGECRDGRLRLRTQDGVVTLGAHDLLLLVAGTIVRERQAALDRRHPLTTRLEEGWRVHLHRLVDPRPVEIDATDFEPGFASAGSTRLEIEAWLREIAAAIPRDDGFRHLVPALGPAQPPPASRLSALDRLRAPALETAVLDNLAQFRFYSGWRAAFERRRRGLGPPAGAC